MLQLMPQPSSRLFSLLTLGLLLLVSKAFAATETDLLADKSLEALRYFSPQTTDIAQVAKFLPDGVLSITGKPNGYLLTKAEYENYQVHLEWRWLAPKGNSGVLVHTTGPDKLWPTSLQFQMKVAAVGEWIPMGDFKMAESLAPGAKSLPRQAPDAEKPVGEWNSADIVCKDGVVECFVNGKLVNRVTKCSPAKGAIGIQLEGTAFELRKLLLTH